MKKKYILIISLVLSCLMLSACNDGGTPPQPATAPPVVTEAEAPETEAEPEEAAEDETEDEGRDEEPAFEPITIEGPVIDFADGDFSFVTPNTNEDGSIDGAEINLSVVEFNGQQQLKVERLDGDVIKPRFDITAILGDEASKCARITMELTVEAQNPDQPIEWASGAIGTSGGDGGGTWAQTDWACPDILDGVVTAKFEAERRFLLPTHRFIDDSPDNHMLVMAWDLRAGDEQEPVGFNLYITNIRFWDDDGGLMELFPS
ncbi:MAG: hypothetical protein FWG90_00370 [Oscillospiraceae bacterium]|nr:hypothetical protein [Oscillospiraceae bacterium]